MDPAPSKSVGKYASRLCVKQKERQKTRGLQLNIQDASPLLHGNRLHAQ
jgi:hypothetical protein